jgi:O-antigen/teichoic acid export membrane protein
LSQRLARGAFWILAGTGLARGLGLLGSIAMARLLGAEQFGELGVIQSTVGLFSVFAGLGLGLTATKHVAEFRNTDPARASRILALSSRVAWGCGLLFALALAALADPLAERSLSAPHLTPLLRISAVLIWLGAVNGAQTGALSGLEAFKAIARVNLRTGLAACVLMILGVLLAGLTGAVWSLVASLALNCLLNHFALRAEARRAGLTLTLRGGAEAEEWRLLWSFSVPAMLCSVMILPVNWVGLTLLAHQSGGYSELGIFNAANQWRTSILFVPQALAGIALPTLANLKQTGCRRQYVKVFWSNVGLIGAVASGIALAVVGASGWIMRTYGNGFSQGRMTLVLLSLAAIVMSVNQALGADVISQGRMWAGLIGNLVWAVTFLSLAWWLVPRQGALGLAMASLGSYPIQSVCLLALNLQTSAEPIPPNTRQV